MDLALQMNKYNITECKGQKTKDYNVFQCMKLKFAESQDKLTEQWPLMISNYNELPGE